MKSRRALVVALIVLLLAALPVSAITYGEPDGGRHPFVGMLVAEFDGQKDWICSGTLISPTVFLTAGHCTAYLEGLEINKVWVSFDDGDHWQSLKLDMPPAGKVVGDYYVSDSFQFDFKAPSEEWQFFEDKEDKKLLVGLQCPGTSAEIRIYYENNLENTKSDKFFEGYLRFAKNRYKEVKDEKAKISNLDGYKVSYVDENSDSSDLVDLSELIGMSEDGPVVVTQKPKKKSTGPREVVKFLLIQVDGVVSIECSTKKGEREKFADVFNKANENFTLTLTRRW